MRAFEKALVEAGNSQPDMLNADFYFDSGAAAEQAGQYVKAGELFANQLNWILTMRRGLTTISATCGLNAVKTSKRRQLIRRALELDPGNGAYVDSLGWLYFKQGKFQEALTELLRAAECFPTQTLWCLSISETPTTSKNAEAVLYWQKALQLSPENKTIATKLDKSAENVAKQPGPNPPPSSQIPGH